MLHESTIKDVVTLTEFAELKEPHLSQSAFGKVEDVEDEATEGEKEPEVVAPPEIKDSEPTLLETCYARCRTKFIEARKRLQFLSATDATGRWLEKQFMERKYNRRDPYVVGFIEHCAGVYNEACRLVNETERILSSNEDVSVILH